MTQKLLALGILISCITVNINAQSNQSIAEYNGRQLAQKMAKKMSDTLNLSGNQKQQIVNVNMHLHNQKLTTRTQNAGQDSIIQVRIQSIENTRDSLYKPILGNQKYLIYKRKKITLLNND